MLLALPPERRSNDKWRKAGTFNAHGKNRTSVDRAFRGLGSRVGAMGMSDQLCPGVNPHTGEVGHQ